jgi:hypothetical protein
MMKDVGFVAWIIYHLLLSIYNSHTVSPTVSHSEENSWRYFFFEDGSRRRADTASSDGEGGRREYWIFNLVFLQEV